MKFLDNFMFSFATDDKLWQTIYLKN
jgi:hypothetical protein